MQIDAPSCLPNTSVYWLAPHPQHLIKPTFSISQLVLPGVPKTISKTMLPWIQIDAPSCFPSTSVYWLALHPRHLIKPSFSISQLVAQGSPKPSPK